MKSCTLRLGFATNASRLRRAIDEIGKHLRGMITRINLVVDSRDFARFVDQDTNPLRVARFQVVTRAISQPKRSSGVAQNRKVVVVLLHESGVLLDAVEARPDYSNVELVEVGLLVAEPAALSTSARCIGLGIKPDQSLATA